MTSSTAGAGNDTRWTAVILGLAVAVVAGIATSSLLRSLYGLLIGPEAERGSFTAAVAVVSLVSGFLSYLLGGYVAAKVARRSGRRHGVLAALAGLLLGIVLALALAPFQVVFVEGVALPPACFGLEGEGLLAGLILFAANLFGGFVGGTIGEPLQPGGRPQKRIARE